MLWDTVLPNLMRHWIRQALPNSKVVFFGCEFGLVFALRFSEMYPLLNSEGILDSVKYEDSRDIYVSR